MAELLKDKATPANSTPVEISTSRTLKEVLQNNYETGKYSDLVVRTPDRDFNVHKSIVCELCPFFGAANRHGWAETHTGLIEVTESAATMDIVFRHLYGAPLPFLPMSKDDDETLVNKASFENFILAVGVLEAADKYLLPELGHASDLALLNCIRFSSLQNLVKIALILRSKSQAHAANLFALTVIKLGTPIHDLIQEETAWYALHAYADLQKMVLDCALGTYGEEGLAKYFEAKIGRPGKDFESPPRRSKWYTKKWGEVFLSI